MRILDISVVIKINSKFYLLCFFLLNIVFQLPKTIWILIIGRKQNHVCVWTFRLHNKLQSKENTIAYEFEQQCNKPQLRLMIIPQNYTTSK